LTAPAVTRASVWLRSVALCPVRRKLSRAAFALALQRHDLQRLHDLVETEQRRAVARLADQQDRQTAVVDRRVAGEGEVVILEGDHAHRQDHVDPGGRIGDLRIAQPRDLGLVFVQQLRALPRGQDARGLQPARDLPVGHGPARARAEGAVDAAPVEAEILHRDLQRVAFLAGQLRLALARLGGGFFLDHDFGAAAAASAAARLRPRLAAAAAPRPARGFGCLCDFGLGLLLRGVCALRACASAAAAGGLASGCGGGGGFGFGGGCGGSASGLRRLVLALSLGRAAAAAAVLQPRPAA
jgi:hypothetical protein